MDRRGFLGALGKAGASAAAAAKVVPFFSPAAATVEEHPAVAGYLEGETVYDHALVTTFGGGNFLVRAPGQELDDAKIVTGVVKGILIRWPRGQVYRWTLRGADDVMGTLDYLGVRLLNGEVARG